METELKFEPFGKIARLKRELVITEKLDGTNAQVAILEINNEDEYAKASNDPYCLGLFPSLGPQGGSPLAMYAGSRKRWVAPEGVDNMKGCDNFAFGRWVSENRDDLIKLGVGRHFGEWYGAGIQRGYGLDEKRFALFNTARWGKHNPSTPRCCHVVPIMEGYETADSAMSWLAKRGSVAVPGYHNPEGVIVWHTASRTYYKQTFEMDGGKWNGN